MPTAFGEKIVMRIFTPEVLVRDFTELGFTAEDRDRWETDDRASRTASSSSPGPTGSGKTTTLYSSLKQLATPEVNVCTVEDPIEMIEPAFNQMQVQPAIGVDFAHGVRTLMRQDPDIIMVGEIRDRDTADMAVQAALTGHLVLSTLHTNDAPTAVTRLLDLGVPPYLHQLDAARRDGAAPRAHAVPALQEARPSRPTTRPGARSPRRGAREKPAQVMVPVGCLECRMTGYLGRIGLYEIMLMTPAMRRLLVARAPTTRAIREQAYKDGMKPLRVSGAMKVAAGLTTADEVVKVAPLG